MQEYIQNKPSAQALGACPSQCNYTYRQNPSIQQNCCNFWTNFKVMISFKIENLFNGFNIVYFMTKAPFQTILAWKGCKARGGGGWRVYTLVFEVMSWHEIWNKTIFSTRSEKNQLKVPKSMLVKYYPLPSSNFLKCASGAVCRNWAFFAHLASFNVKHAWNVSGETLLTNDDSVCRAALPLPGSAKQLIVRYQTQNISQSG